MLLHPKSATMIRVTESLRKAISANLSLEKPSTDQIMLQGHTTSNNKLEAEWVDYFRNILAQKDHPYTVELRLHGG